MKRVLWLILTAFALLFCSDDELFAATLFQQVGVVSSPNPVGSGARAVGMGGAFIAIADDATAASWNPAGLMQLERPEISMAGGCFNQRWDFSSDIHPEIDNTSKSDDFNINYFSATYPFHFYKDMVASVNYQRLYEFKQNFSYRYDYSSLSVDLLQDIDFSRDGYVGALGLACAVRITPKLSLGMTLNIWTDQLLWQNGWKETYSEHGTGTRGGVPVTTYTQITDEYSRFRGWNANLGLLWDMNKWLRFGAVIKTPFDASIRHKFSFRQISMFESPVNHIVSSEHVVSEEVELRMPLSYGLGVAWRVSDALCFDLDVYRTEWSEYLLTDSQNNKFSPIDGRPEKDSDVEDTIQVRIGGEYLFIGQERQIVVPVRGGIFYDPEPSHGTVKDFYGIAVGSGLAYRKFIFDIAYQVRWGRSVDTGNVIATSSADIMQHLLLASIIVHF
ncbi:MAG: outer membrane protein transport protein [Desulfobacterales bacterium]|nr:outer membrane protein transport protein [Desulfobacterales bacterium]